VLALAAAALLQTGARVYFTPEQALAIVFPGATEIRERALELDAAAQQELTGKLGYRPRETRVIFHQALRGEQVMGHAIVMNEVGKSLPITFMVAILPDGQVDQVLLMQFREPRGNEVERAVFRDQYRGKSLPDPIRRGVDIRNVSGATMSVDAMSRGVKRALAFYSILGR
jgi:Na+-translocating ferredoxin:NAD+ oxidoreductase RnfG subunit